MARKGITFRTELERKFKYLAPIYHDTVKASIMSKCGVSDDVLKNYISGRTLIPKGNSTLIDRIFSQYEIPVAPKKRKKLAANA